MLLANDIANRLGLKRYQRSWRGVCPACGYADTFIMCEGRNGRPRLWCASCQDGSAIAAAIAQHTGRPLCLNIGPDAVNAASRERNRERALRLWAGSEPAVGTLADTYLAARGLDGLAASPALRFRGDTPHPEGGRLPALIALVTDVSGQSLGVHRTYLDRAGSKARVEPVKASLGRVWGGAVRLDALSEKSLLVIGEGIESSASAGRLMGLPSWAAISAGNLAKGLLLPHDAGTVVIAADADETGRAAARTAELRWIAEGRVVKRASPNTDSQDFNDVLLAQETNDA